MSEHTCGLEDHIARLTEAGYISRQGRNGLSSGEFDAYLRTVMFNFGAVFGDGMLSGKISAPKTARAQLYKLAVALRAARDLPPRIQLDINLGGFAEKVEQAQKKLPERTNLDQRMVAVVDAGLRLGREYGLKPWMWQRPLKVRIPDDAQLYFSIISEMLGALDADQAVEQDFRRAWENYRSIRTHQTPQ